MSLSSLQVQSSLEASQSSKDLQEIATAYARAERIVVMIGAGASTAAGIPVFISQHIIPKDLLIWFQDYRSPCGLYAKGSLFTEEAFRDPVTRPKVQKQACYLRQLAKASSPTKTHRAITGLRDGGRLLRCYTQNVDMLETRAGLVTDLDSSRVDCIQLHGSLELLCCSICSRTSPTENHLSEILAGEDASCPHCTQRSEKRQMAGKRCLPIGWLRPNIVLIGQQGQPSGEEIGELVYKDLSATPDFLLIMGTSMMIEDFKKTAKRFARTVKANGGMVVYVNLTQPKWFQGFYDHWVPMECDGWVQDLESRMRGLTFENPIVL